MPPYTLVNKPLTITEVFVRGWDIFIATFWSALPFSLILSLISVPGHVAQQTTVQSDVSNPLSVQLSQLGTGTTFLIATLVLMAAFIALFIFCGMYAALIKQIDASVKGKKLNFMEALFAGFSKSFTLLGASIVASIIVLIGLALLVLPGIYIGVALFFVFLLPVVENVGVMSSLKESMRLVSGHWWRTFFSLCIVGLVIGLFQLSVGAALDLVFAANNKALSPVSTDFSGMASIILILVQTAILPLMYSFYLSILYDLQSRKELEPLVSIDKK